MDPKVKRKSLFRNFVYEVDVLIIMWKDKKCESAKQVQHERKNNARLPKGIAIEIDTFCGPDCKLYLTCIHWVFLWNRFFSSLWVSIFCSYNSDFAVIYWIF